MRAARSIRADIAVCAYIHRKHCINSLGFGVHVPVSSSTGTASFVFRVARTRWSRSRIERSRSAPTRWARLGWHEFVHRTATLLYQAQGRLGQEDDSARRFEGRHRNDVPPNDFRFSMISRPPADLTRLLYTLILLILVVIIKRRRKRRFIIFNKNIIRLTDFLFYYYYHY